MGKKDKKKEKKVDSTQLEGFQEPNMDELNADTLKEMKYHYKAQKKAWKKANRKAAWPLRILLFLVVLAIGYTGYKLYEKQNSEDTVESNQQVIPVTVTDVSRRTLVTTYKGNGDIVASSSIDVYPDTASGKVTRIDVELGDYVRKDQVLLLVDPSRPGQTYAQSPVKAPVSGTITSLTTSVGSMVSAQMPIATIGDLSNLEMVAHIPEKYVSNVSLGQETRISLISWEDEYITGRISEISPVVDPNSRTMQVKVNIAQKDSRIRAGMFVRFNMVTEEFPNVLTLPTEAVIERFDKQYVYLVDGDSAKRVEIVSGLSVDGFFRIDEGLNGDEQVVVKGNSLLEDGTQIKIIEETE